MELWIEATIAVGSRYAYQEYFGLSEHPFSITPDPRFVFLSDKHRAALEHLEYGAAEGSNGFMMLTGDVGTGKTTLCRTFLEQVPEKTEVILILNPVLSIASPALELQTKDPPACAAR